MTRLAVIELEVPGTGQSGRVFLDRDMLRGTSVEWLERELAKVFVEAEDQARMARIGQLIAASEPIEVAVHPGESSPPEYHAFLKDPTAPEAPLFACVLVPRPIVAELVSVPPHIAFETATFQAMSADTSPTRMKEALEAWVRRVWPNVAVPRFVLIPWPVETVRAVSNPMPSLGSAGIPRGASTTLSCPDYPSREELCA